MYKSRETISSLASDHVSISSQISSGSDCVIGLIGVNVSAMREVIFLSAAIGREPSIPNGNAAPSRFPSNVSARREFQGWLARRPRNPACGCKSFADTGEGNLCMASRIDSTSSIGVFGVMAATDSIVVDRLSSLMKGIHVKAALCSEVSQLLIIGIQYATISATMARSSAELESRPSRTKDATPGSR